MMDDGGLDVKAVILGATDVGKTSLTMRYCHGTFNHPTSATIGASFLQKRIVLKDGNKMTLQIWDTAGQERFRSMAPMYYRNAKAAILVFDLSKGDESFEKAKEWLEDLRNHVEPDIVLAIVGNKCDSPTEFDFEVANSYAQSIGATAHKSSALTGVGVEEIFQDVARRLMAKHIESQKAVRNKQISAGGSNRGARTGSKGMGNVRLDSSKGSSGGQKGCC